MTSFLRNFIQPIGWAVIIICLCAVYYVEAVASVFGFECAMGKRKR